MEEIINDIVTGCHAILVECQVSRHHRNCRVKIIADTESGITIDLLTTITKRIQECETVDNYFPYGVQLEVSSPGLDYPLTKLYQFKRNIGRKLQLVHTDSKVPSPIEGILKRVDEHSIEIAAGKKNLKVALDLIRQGKLLLR